jgi:starch-binding outer membrane protein SusE/F
MKSLSRILLLSAAFVFAWGCSKVEDIVTLNSNASLAASLSATTLTLVKDNADQAALTVSWTKPEYGFDAAPNYTVFVDKKGNNFSKAVQFSVGAELKKVFKTVDLNNIMLGFELPPNAVSDLEFKVQSQLGASTVFNSAILALKATPYANKLDLSSNWGVVGSATPGGWNGPDLPVYKSTETIGSFVAYVTLIDGAIKLRKDNKWDDNLGGAAGVLKANGDDIAVKAGSYKITFNPTALTYKIEAFTWGIVGDATPNGWDGPDMPMSYDATVDLWVAHINLKDGDIKMRQNNAWTVEYGGAAGALKLGGANIPVKKGTYLITADFKNLKYTVQPLAIWGLVGDATPNGWNGPDQKFTYNLVSETYILEGVKLIAGQIKFRENNAWVNDFGSTSSTEPDPIGTAGGLKAGGKNFGVAAGTWSFELSLKDPANPKYKATKK